MSDEIETRPTMTLDAMRARAATAREQRKCDPLARAVHAVMHPHARAILHRLAEAPASSKAMAADLGLAPPVIAEMLTRLRRAGLVRSEYGLGEREVRHADNGRKRGWISRHTCTKLGRATATGIAHIGQALDTTAGRK